MIDIYIYQDHKSRIRDTCLLQDQGLRKIEKGIFSLKMAPKQKRLIAQPVG